MSPKRAVQTGEVHISSAELELIDLIYAAAADPDDGWPAFIKRFGELYPKARTVLGTYERGAMCLTRSATDIDDETMDAYASHFSAINPVVPPLLETRSNSYFDADELVERDQFLKTEVYNDFWRPQGELSRNVGTILENDGTLFSTFCTHYPDDQYDSLKENAPGAVICRLMPHLRRALALQARLEEKALMSVSLLTAFGQIGQAVFVVNIEGRVQSTNPAADALLQASPLLAPLPLARIRLRNKTDDGLLQSAIQAATSIEDIRSNALLPAQTIRCKEGDYYRLRVAPTIASTTERRWFQTTQERLAFVLIEPVSKGAKLDGAALRDHYLLTPAEVSVAEALHQGLSVKDYADLKDVSLTTVRNQLKSIFAKTGTRRQGALVGLLNRFQF